jgi:sulfur transfer protein SufE
VWLDYHYCADSDRLHYRIDSDTRIIKGLAVLLLELFNDSTPEQILKLNPDQTLHQLGLDQHLSASRSNGLRVIVERMREIASAYSR